MRLLLSDIPSPPLLFEATVRVGRSTRTISLEIPKTDKAATVGAEWLGTMVRVAVLEFYLEREL